MDAKGRQLVLKADPGSACDVCGSTLDVVTFVDELATIDGERVPGVALAWLCAECLAEGMRVGTGFNVPGQLAAWRRIRAARDQTRAPKMRLPLGTPHPRQSRAESLGE